MQKTEHILKNLPCKLIDVDIDSTGGYVAVVGDETKQFLAFGESMVQLPEFIRFPKVRSVSKDCAVVVDARSNEARKGCACLITKTGKVVSSFFAGDGIKDVLVCGNHIVVTYFDEGVFSGIEPSEQGLVAFDFAGNLVLEYQKAFGSEAVDIVDCYCACVADSDRIFFFAYTEFKLVELNLTKRKQTIYTVPNQLRGASAISVRNNQAFFYSPYKNKGEFFDLEIGGDTPRPGGNFSSPLRGLTGGSFLACNESGYTIIAPDLQP